MLKSIIRDQWEQENQTYSLSFVRQIFQQPSIKKITIGTTSPGIQYQLRCTYSYAGTAEVALHIHEKFTLGKFKSSLLS